MSLTAYGAPGVFFETPPPAFRLAGVRRDVAAFVGVASRGPVRVHTDELRPETDVGSYLLPMPARSIAVPVETWGQYQAIFGGFESAGRLPYAVSAFFAQGGRRAYVVRIVHDYDDAVLNQQGCSTGRFGRYDGTGSPAIPLLTTASGPVSVRAGNEGAWGDRVRGELSFVTRRVAILDATPGTITVPVGEWIPVGSLVRLVSSSGAVALRYVDDSVATPQPGERGLRRIVTLDAPVATAATVEVVTARLIITDGDPNYHREEQLEGIGLRADHPRWLARVLIDESRLLWPEQAWVNGTVGLTDPALPSYSITDDSGVEQHLDGGRDRSGDIVPDDFFDGGWVPGDERSAAGVHALAEVEDVALLVVPDLYEPADLAIVDEPDEEPIRGNPRFEPCVTVTPPAPLLPPAPQLKGLRLDPTQPGDLATIRKLQGRLLTFATTRRDITVLLDVPPGIGLTAAQGWRSDFDSPHGAAYHPWVDVALPDDAREGFLSVNPSAFAAGIIAAREWSDGVHTGPANVVLANAVRARESVTLADSDRLHPLGINVILRERDGLRLTGARTLSRSRRTRQLSVVRLLTVIRLTLERELAYLVFEPNNEGTWAAVRRTVSDYLDRLHRSGALAGASPKDSYFVRCGRDTMTANDIDNGRLIALVGIAPSEPIEFIVVRLSVTAEASVQLEVVSD